MWPARPPPLHVPGVTDQRPPDTAPPLAWAVWYLEQGLWPLPIRDALDLAERREQLFAEKLEELGEEAAAAWAAERVERGRKHTFIPWRKMRSPPTLGQLRAWWSSRPERGIALLCGPGKKIAVIDVDTAKGGDPSPWIEGCSAVAETPSGGVHLVYREEAIRSTTSVLAPGVDTRGVGGLIAAPAGSASPGRRWLRWSGVEGLESFPAPAVAALALGRLETPGERLALGGGEEGADEITVPATREDRSFAAALAEPALDGERHRKAAAIVGLLARPRPVPRDAVAKALGLLEAWSTSRGLSLEVHRAIERAWRSALEAPTREGGFVLELLTAWNEVRGTPSWPRSKVEETAAGLWRTASTREEERARGGDGGGGEEEDALNRLLPSRAETYTRANFARDRRRGLLPIDTLPAWANYTGEIDHTCATGHGWGEVLNAALGGGLTPQYFLVLGAEQAKGGKTAFSEQLLMGLALRSVAVLAGTATGPVIVPYYLGEMWQGSEGDVLNPSRSVAHRDLARWLGVDGNLFRRGDETGGDAPGIRRLAEELHRDSGELAIQVLETADRVLEQGPFYRARQLMPLFNTRALMSSYDKQEERGPSVDHRRGVPLLRSVTAAILADRERKAKQWNRAPSEIWPLLFIDPIQRYQAGGDNAVASLDEFVEELRAIADEHGFIVVGTSDTNKDSAKGGVPKDATPFARAAWVFRGSYKLLHLPDAALVLSVEWPKDRETSPLARVWVGLNRWGAPAFEPAHYNFRAESGRFEPTQPINTSLDDLEEEPPEKPRRRGRFTKADV